MTEEHRKNDETMMITLATIKQELLGMKEIAELTLEQARKTNGRVNVLETEVTILKVINAGNEGEKKAMKPYQTAALSIIGSILAAIGINWVMK